MLSKIGTETSPLSFIYPTGQWIILRLNYLLNSKDQNTDGNDDVDDDVDNDDGEEETQEKMRQEELRITLNVEKKEMDI